MVPLVWFTPTRAAPKDGAICGNATMAHSAKAARLTGKDDRTRLLEANPARASTARIVAIRPFGIVRVISSAVAPATCA
jgi:hypothetical protein